MLGECLVSVGRMLGECLKSVGCWVSLVSVG